LIRRPVVDTHNQVPFVVSVSFLTTPLRWSLKKFDTHAYSSPHKSLVKDVRFIRSEEKPEYFGAGRMFFRDSFLSLLPIVEE